MLVNIILQTTLILERIFFLLVTLLIVYYCLRKFYIIFLILYMYISIISHFIQNLRFSLNIASDCNVIWALFLPFYFSSTLKYFNICGVCSACFTFLFSLLHVLMTRECNLYLAIIEHIA